MIKAAIYEGIVDHILQHKILYHPVPVLIIMIFNVSDYLVHTFTEQNQLCDEQLVQMIE